MTLHKVNMPRPWSGALSHEATRWLCPMQQPPREALSGRIKDTQIKGSGFSPRTPALLLLWRVHTRNLHLVSSQNALLLKVIRHLSNAKVTIKRQGTCPLESASCPAPPFPGTPFPPHWPLQRLAVSRPRPRY